MIRWGTLAAALILGASPAGRTPESPPGRRGLPAMMAEAVEAEHRGVLLAQAALDALDRGRTDEAIALLTRSAAVVGATFDGAAGERLAEVQARVVAARVEIETGNVALAQRLLMGLPAGLRALPDGAALSQARVALRAAAGAALADEPGHAHEWLLAAEDILEVVQASSDPRLAAKLRPVVIDVRQLEFRVASGNVASPRELRALADRLARLEQK